MRYEVRETEVSDVVRPYAIRPARFVVWDTREDTPVPFGRFSTRLRAVERAVRMNLREDRGA